MTGEAWARFMELRGWKVIEGAGSLWQQFHRGCYISFPLHISIDPAPGELDSLLRSNRALCLRYSSARPRGLAGGLYVVREKKFGFANVHSKVRGKLRRGLERCEVKAVDADLLAREGLRINRETMDRQNRFEPEFGDPKRWKRFVEAIRLSSNVSVLGAFVDGRLHSYGVLHREDSWIYLLYQMSLTSALQHAANTALHYEVCRLIAADGIEAICSGPLPLANSRLHNFKTQMGMTVLPQTFAFRFHPALAPVASAGGIQTVVGGLRRIWPRNPRLEVMSNVLRGSRFSNYPARHADEVVPC